jgi:hypothetical protein
MIRDDAREGDQGLAELYQMYGQLHAPTAALIPVI